MNFINRAIKNVTRRLSKTILLVLTFFLIGNLVIIGLGISSASKSAKTLTRQKMRAVVTYQIDYEKVWRYADTIEDEDELQEFYQNYPRVKVEDVSEFLKDERVRMANSISSNMWYSDQNNSLDFVHLGNTREQNMEESQGQSCWTDMNGTMNCETYKEPTFFIKSNMYPGMIEFEDGDYQIVSGRFYNQEEIDKGEMVVVISQNLANTNGLVVGDNITLASNYLSTYISQAGITAEDLESTFEVIGIYTHNNPLTPDNSNFDYASPYENPDNMIFMPSTSVYMAQLPMQQKQYDFYAQQYPEEEYYSNPDNRPSEETMERNMYIENVTLLLDDPLNVDKFVEDYQSKLSQFTSLDANNDEFNRLAKPLDTLSMYAKFIVWLVVINAIVIITLVTALTLKTREYEIGVLLSVGASKLKVIAQFFIELAIVAIIGFTLSVASGSLISRQIGNMVLEAQIASSDVNTEDDMYDYNYIDPWSTDYTTDITLDDLVSEYEVTVSPLIIAEIYVLGLAIVLISVIIPSFMIMRYNPKKILMNQN
ncbi:MAG: FtsX-like permease family protein [Erysipelotrichaceae bacterium]|nr:FtsX-like permease family protein [Erysipelotrichaceae bacterium]